MFTSGVQFGGVFAYKAHVSVEFGNGAKINDSFGFFDGTGKGRRCAWGGVATSRTVACNVGQVRKCVGAQSGSSAGSQAQASGKFNWSSTSDYAQARCDLPSLRGIAQSVHG